MTEIADMGELVRPRQICSKYYAHTKREQAFFAVFIVLSSYGTSVVPARIRSA
ncbi:hypothetical protein [Deinococcus sp.]|uniref:hypothetical protein n=1 Tax=Deinococcus sp. TaxID=47478 RepID=UPI0025C09151|nr:hypothetical protein [Deinococcus sp.]